MKFGQLISATRNMPYFDLPTIAQLSGEPRQSLRMQLCRLVRQGKLNIKQVQQDVRPFLEKQRETDLITRENLESLVKTTG